MPGNPVEGRPLTCLVLRTVISWGLDQVSRKVSQGSKVWVKQAPVGQRRHREPDNSCHREGNFELPQIDQSTWWGGGGTLPSLIRT